MIDTMFDCESQSKAYRRDLLDLLTVYLDTGRRFSNKTQDEPVRELKAALDWSHVTCLGLCMRSFRVTHVLVLLLQPSLEGGSFVRTGLVQNFPNIWFDEHATSIDVNIV